MLAASSAFPPAASSIAIASLLPIPPIAISEEIASSGYRPAGWAGAEAAGAGADEPSVLPEPGKDEVAAAGAEPEAEAAPGGGATRGIGLPCLRVASESQSASEREDCPTH